jgi:hypothetical protein
VGAHEQALVNGGNEDQVLVEQFVGGQTCQS